MIERAAGSALRGAKVRAAWQWIEAEIVYVREATDGDGDLRFCPEVAFTPPESDEVRVEASTCPSAGLRRTWPAGLPGGGVGGAFLAAVLFMDLFT
ncbi:hypothetical protein [Streptomyces sp. NPDC003635]